MSGWPPSGRKRKSHDLEDIVEDALESPFNALENIFDSLGDLFSDSDIHSDGTPGVRTDMEKLRSDLHKMKRDLEKGKNAMRVPAEPVMPSNVSLSGGAVFSIGNTEKKHKHYMKLKDEEGNFIEVTFNSPSDLSIKTEGNLDSELISEIKRHVRQQLRVKEPNVLRTKETYEVEEPTSKRSPLLWTRSWRGDKKDPLDFSPTESKVTVAGHSMLGRKYEVAVDGTTIYIVKIEEIMERRHQVGGDALDIFVESWTDDEKAIMLKVFDGLEALEIIEEHHEAARKLISP